VVDNAFVMALEHYASFLLIRKKGPH